MSNPNDVFAIGITLTELSAVSTDEHYKSSFIQVANPVVHKLLKLSNLSVYFNTKESSIIKGISGSDDITNAFLSLIPSQTNPVEEHQFLLRPVSGEGRLKITRNPQIKVPKIRVFLDFEEFAFCINNEQYKNAFLLFDQFDCTALQNRYRKFRPPKGVTVSSKPRAWLQYAAMCILSDIRDKRQRYTWDAMRERRDDRRRYIDLYVSSKLNRCTPAESAELTQLERKLSYEDILFYRSLSKPRLRKERRRTQETQVQKAGWFSSFWYAQTTNSEDSAAELTNEQIQDLYKTIDYSETAGPVSELPREYVYMSCELLINRGSLTFRSDPHTANKTLVSLALDTLLFKMVLRSRQSYQTSMAIRAMTMFDGVTENTRYPYLMKVKESEYSGPSLLHNELVAYRNQTLASQNVYTNDAPFIPFFEFEFENKPLDDRTNLALLVKMRHIQVVFNPKPIYIIVEFLTPPIQASIQLRPERFNEFMAWSTQREPQENLLLYQDTIEDENDTFYDAAETQSLSATTRGSIASTRRMSDVFYSFMSGKSQASREGKDAASTKDTTGGGNKGASSKCTAGGDVKETKAEPGVDVKVDDGTKTGAEAQAIAEATPTQTKADATPGVSDDAQKMKSHCQLKGPHSSCSSNRTQSRLKDVHLS